MCVADVEVDRGAVPAALLDARDGDRQLRAGADEHRHVEDAVLLRADELLAVVEQHGLVERVDHGELGHRAGVGDLGDREPARQRLVERDVGRDGIAGGEERRDHDAAVLDRVAELEGEGCGRCHVVLLSGSERSPPAAACLTSGARRCSGDHSRPKRTWPSARASPDVTSRRCARARPRAGGALPPGIASRHVASGGLRRARRQPYRVPAAAHRRLAW